MANQGVFNRDLTQLEAVPRSLQRLQHRHVFDGQYGEVMVNFSEILYPNESMHLKTTNFIRSIPMKTPQLSRVRIFQRYIAVPPRLLWRPWEEYINALNPVEVVPTEPYICNFNGLGKSNFVATSGSFPALTSTAYASRSASDSDLWSDSIPDYSISGIFGVFNNNNADFTYRLHRGFVSGSNPRPTVNSGTVLGYQFFPHELGDRLNAPIFITSLSNDTSSRFSAFKFAAYQLSYNFFYRRPNVEERTDDYFEMFHNYGDRFYPEYDPIAYGFEVDSNLFASKPVSRRFSRIGIREEVLSRMASSGASGKSFDSSEYFNLIGHLATFDSETFTVLSGFTPVFNTDLAYDSATTSKRRTEWKNCEKYILRSGANLNMLCTYLDNDGNPQQEESYLSLTRTRFAPWLMDRFTSANPWPQRGTEAQIPVNALTQDVPVKINGLTLYAGNVSSSAQTIASGAGVRLSDPSQANFVSYIQNVSPNSVTWNAGSGSKALVTTVDPGSLFVSPSNFRFYMQLQHAKEKSGMTDGRYKSYMSMFFGSRLRNNQIDYPEFIGGFVQDLNVSEIEQTSESANTPLGTLAGKGVSARKGVTIRFHAVEHTIILGLMHIIPDAVYLGGLNRQDHTTNPFDWVLPDFAGLSEQPIRLSELCVRSSSTLVDTLAGNDLAFGYEPRYNERRARHSYATGAFRDIMNSTGSYEYYKPWLVTRNFSYDVESAFITALHPYPHSIDYTVPTLSKEFLSTRHSMDYSNFEVTNPDVMYPFMIDSYHDESIASIIPRRGIPRM